MALSLKKGDKVDLTKGNAGLSKILVGLGWIPKNTMAAMILIWMLLRFFCWETIE